MTPTELNQLPQDQQQNALLAIALGYQIAVESDEYYVISEPFLDEADYYDFGSAQPLKDWQPQNDKALMWDLVCGLGTIGYTQISFERISTNYNVCLFSSENNHYGNLFGFEYGLIAAYISADLKGNIAKWRKENDAN